MMNTVKNKATCVYMARNIKNDEFYIGITSRGLKTRKYQHIKDAFIPMRMGRIKFYNAIRKYGAENFIWTKICSLPTYAEALEMEKFLINEMNPSYNLTKGGEGMLGVPSYWKGKKLTKISIEKRSESRKKSPKSRTILNRFNYNSKRVISKKCNKIFCLNDGKIYTSQKVASFVYGVLQQHIGEVCKGKRKSIGGFKFKYLESE